MVEPDKPLTDTALIVTAFEHQITRARRWLGHVQCPVPYSLYLVDNGSKDDTFDYFSQVKDAKVIRLSENQESQRVRTRGSRGAKERLSAVLGISG